MRHSFTLGAHQKPTVGDTKMSVINSDHMGWLRCDGREVSKSDFYMLFRVIGYSFGGAGDLFKLPDARGRVPGVVGEGTDNNSLVQSFALGASLGEYMHTLTIPEMPTHNHGVAQGVQNATNKLTSTYTHAHGGATGSSGLHNHGITDPGHTHTYVGVDSQSAGSGNTDNVAENFPRPTETTSSSATGITINDAGTHTHTIASDTHSHEMNPAGGSEPHNNIQPTLVVGNMFMYSGRPTYPFSGFPYTTCTQIL